MKKLLTLLFFFNMMIFLTSCSKKTYEIALVTDIGTIDDKSFNQGAWQGIEKYAKEENKSYRYYIPKEKEDESYLEAIDLAVEGGARLVICPGYLFETAVYNAQTKYPNVFFIILDSTPKKDEQEKIEDNVYSILFAEEQAGFLAGYAAVKDGYQKLGFMGGISVPAVINYGYGFLQGADYAAKEMKATDIQIKYHYTNGFDATPEVENKAKEWYREGVECIFACGGGVGNSVMSAAEEEEKVVIGVDVDQSSLSPTVITSAMKQLENSVYDGISDFYNSKFPGGKKVILDAKMDGIGLPFENSEWQQFTKEEYEEIYNKLKFGKITLLKDGDVENPSKIPLEIVKLEIVN